MTAASGVLLEFSALFTAFSSEEANCFSAFLLPGTATRPVTIPFNAFLNLISRKHEYEADAFAAEALISVPGRPASESLSSVNSHPWIVLTGYSHPMLSQRIEYIRKHESTPS